VGRLVLMVLGEPRTADRFEASDAICTALQLTNHWQDIRRDVIERDRIYLPRDMIRIDDFDRRLADTAREGHAPDREFFGAARELVRSCVARTWPLYERGESLLQLVGPGARPVVWLLAAGGQQVLRQIELWNYETALHRPRLGRMRRASLVWRAWRMARTARRGGART
jgi:phytoene/squalene synthetase